MFPTWLVAGLWGLLAGGALLIGAVIGFLLPVPRRVVATVMAFGSGVLISVLAFELMADAYQQGGVEAATIGFLGGALVYTIANHLLNRRGARHRKRAGDEQASELEQAGSGLAIAVGALLDGVPESIAIGLSMLEGGAVSLAVVAAIFLSNLPEGLSSAAGMKRAGRSVRYVFGVWGGIALISGLAAWAGYAVFQMFPPGVMAATTAVAAGAILAMLVDTMIPEAFEEAHDLTGLVTALGFLLSFFLSQMAG